MTDNLSAAERKEYPIFSGVLRYFPDAIMEIAKVSKKGNDQHNPGQPLHWAKEKSIDHPDALLRHLKDAGSIDTDGERHTAKVAWRALAMLQMEIENERATPPSKRAVRGLTAEDIKHILDDGDKNRMPMHEFSAIYHDDQGDYGEFMMRGGHSG